MLERLPPLDIHWKMKDPDSARTVTNQLPDGRLELKIKHETIQGVTPEMLVWWFKKFPDLDNYEYRGQQIHVYRLWHPVDHIYVKVNKPSPEGKGFSRGAKVEICEALDDKIEVMKANITKMDESGITLHLKKGPLTVARVSHTFTKEVNGTFYETQLLLGPTIPIIGKIISKIVQKQIFTESLRKAWLKHNVEEVGNFQFFLPDLFSKFNS